MPEEALERPDMNIQFSQRQASLLASVAIAASLLMVILIVAMIGFVFYGAIAASGIVLMGGLFCLAGSFIMFGLFTSIVKISGIQKAQREPSPARDAEVAQGLNERAQTAEGQNDRLDRLGATAKERAIDALAQGRETYAKAKEELSTHYKRAKEEGRY